MATTAQREAPVFKRGFEWFARALFRVYAPLRVAGALPAEPSLVCSNHTSHLDGVALMVAAGLPFASFRLLAAADYFSHGSRAGRLTRGILDIVGIDRGDGRATRLRRTVAECDALVRGEQVHLIAFPEGTRSVSGGLLPFKRGTGFLAVALGVPVVPAYIDGAHRAMPKGAWLPRPRPVGVRFGPPIRPAEWAGLPRRRARCDYVMQELERRIGDLAVSDRPCETT